MSSRADLDALEREAYRASYSDGTIDLFAGLSLVWIGAAWLWLPDIAGLAGVLPAIFIAPMMSARRRFMGSRTGYVEWRAPRRQWERRILWLLFGAGVAVLGLGVVAFLFVQSESATSATPLSVGPGLLAWLLALLALALAFLTSAWRMVGYAAVLAVTGLLAIVIESNPGLPLLLSGFVVSFTGVSMLRRFVREHPARDEA